MAFFFMVLLANGMLLGTCTNEVISLCSDAKNVDYENYTSSTTTQNYGCENTETCVRKCCQVGFVLDHEQRWGDGLCAKHPSDPFSVPVYDGVQKVRSETKNFLIENLNCNTSGVMYVQMIKNDPEQQFYIQENGSVYLPFHNVMYGNERYCIDGQDDLTLYLCFTNPSQASDVTSVETLIHVIAKLVSLPFLLITGVVYALLPHRNLHRQAVMLHSSALFFGNSCLAIGQYTVIYDDTLCFLLGYFILFFMMVSIFWMNVLCIDIWLPFGCLRRFYVKENTKRKIRVLATIYAWGFPALIFLIVFLLNTYGDVNAVHHPGIGEESCFLRNGLPTIIYYFGPILVLILINLILFVMTAISIRKIRKQKDNTENSDCKKLSSKEKRFKLYWKLLFVMGLNPVVNTYIIQMISYSIARMSHDIVLYIWYFKDISHACYGILVFIIFVCQRKIWKILKKRFSCARKSDETDRHISMPTSNSLSVKETSAPAIQLTEMQNKSADIP